MSQADLNTTTGATMTPTGIIGEQAIIDALRTSSLTLGGNQVEGISHDYTEENLLKLASILAVRNSSAELKAALDKLGRDLSNIYLTPVLSEVLAPPNFSDLSKWLLGEGWVIEDSDALYINRKAVGPDQAILRLASTAFISPGLHFVDMTVTEIEAGAELIVRNEAGEVFKKITSAGQYRFEILVDNPATTYLEFVAGYLDPSYTIRIDEINVYHVKNSFSSYMYYMSGKIISGGSGFASIDDINNAVNNLDVALRAYVNTTVDGKTSQMTAHIADTTSNPHNITPALIRAAKEVHRHLLDDIDGVTDQILTPISQNAAMLLNLTNAINTHFSAINPHGITPAIIKAANEKHLHLPEDINGLVDFEAYVKDLETSVNAHFTAIENRMDNSQSDATVVADMLRKHEQKTGNVHGAAPVDFGIVLATPAEAVAGTSSTLYMSVQDDRAALEAYVAEKNVDPVKLNPRYLGRFSLKSSNLSVNIPVIANRRYQFVLSGIKQMDLRNVTMTANGSVQTVNGSANHISFVQKAGSTIVSETVNGWKFVPSTAQYTTVQGTYDFDTNTGVLRGRGIGYILNSSFVSTGVTDLLDFTSAFDTPVQIDSLDTLTIAATAIPAGAEIIIDMYELMSVDNNQVVTDANPVGTIIYRMGTAPLTNYSLFDGSVLPRSIYAELLAYANTTGMIVNQATWDSEVATNGYCEKFGMGDGTTTFRLPKLKNDTVINPYIKLNSKLLPSPAQVMYQFVWGS